MGFIMEFAENLVLKLMEDPKERDRRFREHVYRVKDRCEKTKEMWSYPMRPYGFWTFERHNSQLAWDAQISQVAGRRDPYDDILQHFSTPPNVAELATNIVGEKGYELGVISPCNILSCCMLHVAEITTGLYCYFKNKGSI
ncbi:hypothetical protein JHK85_021427 [Glycine max]|nr:hypothetical protein JHK85_021427 [Glycine max]KAG5025082.1 hypothetical protein JHK86_020996 [Glycine max]